MVQSNGSNNGSISGIKESEPKRMGMRTHIVLPEDLLSEVDRLAGKRRRSRFVEAAVREKLRREALSLALEDSAGVLSAADYPEWVTPEKASAWVRSSRRADNERLVRKLRRPAN